MEILLIKAMPSDAVVLHSMQIKAFTPLYEKYHDDETSPVKETVEKILIKMAQPETTYFKITLDGTLVGGIRVFQISANRCRVSPIFILPEYQNKGIAQKVISSIEKIYSKAVYWCLDTILQEEGNCYLYEKLGYFRTGEEVIINDNMTLVSYEKHIIDCNS